MVRRRFLGVLSSMNATVCFRAEVPYKLRTTGSQPSGRTRDLERRSSYVSMREVQKDAHMLEVIQRSGVECVMRSCRNAKKSRVGL